MKWYNAKKKKPHSDETVLICPSSPIPLAYWNGIMWINALYPLPAFPSEVKVEKWAYIDYPLNSFDFIHHNLMRRHKGWLKMKRSLKKKIFCMST